MSPNKIKEWISGLEAHASQALEKPSVTNKELKKTQQKNQR